MRLRRGNVGSGGSVEGMPINAQLLDNPKSDRVRRIADLTRTKGRRKSGRFLVEGPQSVREAIRYASDVITDIYVAGDEEGIDSDVLADIAQRAIDASADLYVHTATREVIDHISPDAQGIIAVGDTDKLRAGMDAKVENAAGRPKGMRVAAFWQVRDPGNAGTVIRAADAAGCDVVVFVDDCVDMLNPKVIRSTTGSLFHIPVITMGTREFFDWMGQQGLDVWAADVYGTRKRKPERLPDVLDAMREEGRRGEGYAVLFGNEARGLNAKTIEQCQRVVTIPLYGKAESLNLATSAAVILMSLAFLR
ncbi:RNA methyltransferase, TrmH family [Bifidobacterium merycicum DSM 6492]|nr:RNA methyltransferase, TrmH family [Bifidobacterium merycicum DSM 6492]